MSNMRNCEYVEFNQAYNEARSLSKMSDDAFYEAVKGKALQVQFPTLKKLGIGSLMVAQAGEWERTTNGQGPIYSTYKGYVTWKGDAKSLLKEAGL